MTYGGDSGGPQNPFGGLPDPFSGPPGPFGGFGGTGFPNTPAPPRQPQETNSLATLSVVFAFVFAPAGAVLGHLALAELRRHAQHGRQRAMVGLSVSYAIIVVAVVALVAWQALGRHSDTPSAKAGTATSTVATTTATMPLTTPPKPPKPQVSAADLPAFLLTLDEVKQQVNAPRLSVTNDFSELTVAGDYRVNPRQCETAMNAAIDVFYGDKPVRSVYGRGLGVTEGDKVPVGVVLLDEYVLAFDDSAAAQQAVSGIVSLWRSCAGHAVTTDAGETDVTMMGSPKQTGAVTTLRGSWAGVTDLSIGRAIAAKGNVVVDLNSLIFRQSDELNTLMTQILDRIPS